MRMKAITLGRNLVFEHRRVDHRLTSFASAAKRHIAADPCWQAAENMGDGGLWRATVVSSSEAAGLRLRFRFQGDSMIQESAATHSRCGLKFVIR